MWANRSSKMSEWANRSYFWGNRSFAHVFAKKGGIRSENRLANSQPYLQGPNDTPEQKNNKQNNCRIKFTLIYSNLINNQTIKESLRVSLKYLTFKIPVMFITYVIQNRRKLRNLELEIYFGLWIRIHLESQSFFLLYTDPGGENFKEIIWKIKRSCL